MASTHADTLMFPVMVVSDGGAWVALTASDLTTTHRSLIARMYRGTLVDSTGRTFGIVAAEVERPERLWARIRQSWQHTVKVKLSFSSDPHTVSLDHAKALLLESLDKRPDVAGRFPGLEHEQRLRRQVCEADSFEQVFRLLHEFNAIPGQLR